MPYDAYLSNGKVHDVHGMAELCDESGVIYVLDRGYVDYNLNPYKNGKILTWLLRLCIFCC
jgi:hypothetical protein